MIIGGGPALGTWSLSKRRELFARDHDDFRRMTIEEPRGSGVLVGALLVEPRERGCVAGAIFYNNVGVLGMCGHGTVGIAKTLAHLGRIDCGTHRLDTPVGVVEFTLRDDGVVEVANVPARRSREAARVDVEGIGEIVGDVAWGGNWFFLTHAPSGVALDRSNTALLTAHGLAIRAALARADIRGDDGAEIDHIEFSEPAKRSDCAWRNFVLCPGGMYDRSPCGTGTSAKLACLAADGALAPGEHIGAESFIGTRFEAWYARRSDGAVLPTVAGRAWITAELDLLVDETDPCGSGAIDR